MKTPVHFMWAEPEGFEPDAPREVHWEARSNKGKEKGSVTIRPVNGEVTRNMVCAALGEKRCQAIDKKLFDHHDQNCCPKPIPTKEERRAAREKARQDALDALPQGFVWSITDWEYIEMPSQVEMEEAEIVLVNPETGLTQKFPWQQPKSERRRWALAIHCQCVYRDGEYSASASDILHIEETPGEERIADDDAEGARAMFKKHMPAHRAEDVEASLLRTVADEQKREERMRRRPREIVV